MENNLCIKKTNISPEIISDINLSTIYIKGDSLLDNPSEFYNKVEQFIKQSLFKNNKIYLNFTLENFNTATEQILLELFQSIEPFYKNGSDCYITWNIPLKDSVFVEVADDLLQSTTLPYNIII